MTGRFRNMVFMVPLIAGLSISGCISVKQIGLYPQSTIEKDSLHIKNLYSLHIFSDYLTSEIWHTENRSCIQVENVFDGQYSGAGALKITWNKPQSNCTWIGMGIGWDDWYAKDLHQVIDTAAIQFYVRNMKGTTKGLPWAIALEDYGNAQAWAGMTPNYIANGEVTEAWTKVTVPLSAFDFAVQEPDLTSIKQLVIQFEGDGAVMIDDIQIVPFSGTLHKKGIASIISNAPVIDGIITAQEWPASDITLENGTIALAANEEFLFVKAEVSDSDPMVNTHTADAIWNGDAIEIAFSTNPHADTYRKKFLLSDKHIGIRVQSTPYIWDWSAKKALNGYQVQIRQTPTGYFVEAAIPWTTLECLPWNAGNIYGIEIGIDDGSTVGSRKKQTRWNNNYTEGFHVDPSMWGEIHIVADTEMIK